MAEARVLSIYLDAPMLKRAEAGHFGFVNRVSKAFAEENFKVHLRPNSFDERLKSGARRGYSIFYMDEPFHTKSLTMRRAYYFPYWRLERTSQRWDFQVAARHFDPLDVDGDAADVWFSNWRKWLFKRGPATAEKSGMIYVPLQGRLAEKRSFQSMSPFAMIEAVQMHAGERKILLALHPGEHYDDEEHAVLAEMAENDPRITIQTGGMEEALRLCDLVVTQNSAAALSGFFFQKPAILFGDTDFHHQMPRVSQVGVDDAWLLAHDTEPAFAKYLYWFIHLNAIKADVEGEAEERIINTCRSFGWEI